MNHADDSLKKPTLVIAAIIISSLFYYRVRWNDQNACADLLLASHIAGNSGHDRADGHIFCWLVVTRTV